MATGSVDKDCPRCKQPEKCYSEIHIRTGEYFEMCSECGYLKEFYYARDSEGAFLRKDPTKGDEFENLIPIEKNYENPYGLYRIENTNRMGSFGTLETEDDLYKFVAELIAILTQDDHYIKEVEISRLVGVEIKREVIFQTKKGNEMKNDNKLPDTIF